LQRFAHRITDFLGEGGFDGLVIERQDGDGLDVGREAAAGEAVEAGAEEERDAANGDRATAPA